MIDIINNCFKAERIFRCAVTVRDPQSDIFRTVIFGSYTYSISRQHIENILLIIDVVIYTINSVNTVYIFTCTGMYIIFDDILISEVQIITDTKYQAFCELFDIVNCLIDRITYNHRESIVCIYPSACFILPIIGRIIYGSCGNIYFFTIDDSTVKIFPCYIVFLADRINYFKTDSRGLRLIVYFYADIFTVVWRHDKNMIFTDFYIICTVIIAYILYFQNTFNEVR